MYLAIFQLNTKAVFSCIQKYKACIQGAQGPYVQYTGAAFTVHGACIYNAEPAFCHILTAFNCVLIVFNCMSLYFNCIDLYLQCTGTAFTGHGACIYNAQGLHLEPRALTCTGVSFRVHRGLIYVHRGCIQVRRDLFTVHGVLFTVRRGYIQVYLKYLNAFPLCLSVLDHS